MDDSTLTINPKRSMLLVMDYQPGILKRLTNADELVDRMAAVIEMARRKGVQIGYVRVAFADEDYAAIPKTNKRFSELTAGRKMHHEAPETAVHRALTPHDGDLVVRKTRVGAFSTTDLDEQLRKRDIDTLILAGISTSGVVLSTVRDASDRDYRIFVLEDVSADTDKVVHELLTQKVFPRQASVITSEELFKLLDPQ